MRRSRARRAAAALAVALGVAGAPSAAPADEPVAPGSGAPEATASGAGAAGCAEAVARAVQAHYDDVRDLRARFEQTSRSAALSGSGLEEEPQRGEVVFAKPGRMRWSYEAPEPSLVVSDGRTLWVVDPAAGEAQRMTVEEGFLSGAAMQFLMGEGRILDAFDVGTEDCDGEPVHLVLDPKQPAAYERLELWVDAASGAVVRTAITTAFNRTEVAFEDVVTNRGTDPATFRFDAPEGMRVLELDAAGR